MPSESNQGDSLTEGSDISSNSNRISRLESIVEQRLAATTGDWTPQQIKEFVESILVEKDRALEMAADEREKAASALRNEQQRADDQAEREREKAAEALRNQLTERIAQGDGNLREHISAQISQLTQLVNSVEAVAMARHDGLQREAKIQHDSDQAAIAKAETANEVRFAAANEWRGQSADRERTQQEQIASFVATLTPLSKTQSLEDKLVALIDRDREDIQALRQLRTLQQGQEAGLKLSTSIIVTLITVAVGIIGTIIVLANYLTN